MTQHQGSMAQLRLTSFPLFAYAPQFTAIALHAFESENIEVSLVEYSGPWSGLIDAIGHGASDIIIGNMWFALQQSHHPNALLPIAHCLQHCGTLLLERSGKDRQPFEWRQLQGSSISVQSDVPTPWIALRESLALSEVSIDSVRVLVGFNTSETVDAIMSGAVDYGALHIDRAQVGELQEVAALADVLGPVPWSVFLANSQHVEANPDLYRRFKRAIGVALEWIRNHTGREVAELIGPWFPGIDLDTATRIVERYRALNGWPAQPVIKHDDVARWQKTLVRWGLMSEPIPLEGLLSFAEATNPTDSRAR